MSVYCITGGNRGLGLEFVRQLAANPQNTILATSRSTSSDDVSDLKAVCWRWWVKVMNSSGNPQWAETLDLPI
jgi:NAD(P)-dependent dehydrogenase (short-subunit alcohol dehydrogenase family)